MDLRDETYMQIDRIREYALTIFQEHENSGFLYHNATHTQKVVNAATQIGEYYKLSDEDFFVLLTAAWFHDIGYFDDMAHHEEKSVARARRFLNSEQVEQRLIDRISDCIMATRMPQKPASLVEQILCDADLFHLGTEEFAKNNKVILKECKLLYNKYIAKNDWNKKTIQFLKSHHYHTGYAREVLNSGKERNREGLEIMTSLENDLSETRRDKESMKKEKKKKPKRGIETMFRITSNNHQRLSDMADNKATIMITVNSIILSVLLSVLLRKLEENPTLTIPVILLISVNVITLIFAILATRPHTSEGMYTQKDVDDKKVNLLFFGNFYKMTLNEYTKSVLQMMDDNDYLYRSLIKDVYAQGVVLGRKYKLLRSAYNVFMFGIIVSVIAFLIGALASGR